MSVGGPSRAPSRGSGQALREAQDRLRASGERDSRFHGNDGLGRTEHGSPRFALREPQGERNTVPPGSPFGRLRAGPSRASGRAEPSSPRLTLRQAQARPFESLRASGTRLPPVHPSAGSGQALREPQGERNTALPGSPFGRLRAGPSRASGRTEHGSPRLTLRQAQDRPFERLRASGTRLPPVHPSAGSGQALREPQGERNTALPG